jgi:predicted ATP-grasp superfamily ATP-dependent carboligase
MMTYALAASVSVDESNRAKRRTDRESMRALIVESGSARGAVSAVRALRAAGWTVGVASPTPGPAAASRHAERWHGLEPPEQGAEEFLRGVASAVDSAGYEIVFGAGDAEVLSLSAGRSRLAASLPLAPHAAVVRSFDKLELAGAAAASGIETPRTWETADAVPADFAGPLVVKARLHFTPGPAAQASSRLEPRLVADLRQARAAADAIARAGGDVLLQEFVRGRLMSWAGVFDPGSGVLAAVQQESLRTWPLDAGVTARGITVPLSSALSSRIEAMLARLEWSGLAQLQFLMPPDGVPRLIDFNGRFYGSIGLAIAAGANLPAVWAAAATGRPVPRAVARPGVRFQWLRGDLLGSLTGRRPVELGRCGLWTVGAFHPVWRADDPRPALRASAQFVRRRAAAPRLRRRPLPAGAP